MVRKLDYGCGCGLALELTPDRKRYHNWLVENGGSDVYGIDIDQRKVDAMRRLVHPETRLYCVDAHQTMFPAEYFDEIHIAGVLHHMANYKAAISEIDRIAKPGCRLYILESVDNDPVFRLGRSMLGHYRGDEIASRFNSEQLITEVCRYFRVEAISHYWRFWLSDLFMHLWGKEPRISLVFNNAVNNLLSTRVKQAIGSHVVMVAEKVNSRNKGHYSSG